MTRLTQLFQGLTLPSSVNVGRLTSGANVLLVLLLAYSMATITWQLMPTSSAGSTTTSFAPISSGITQRASSQDLSAVATLHLLGEAGSVPVANDEPIDAPETRLKFTLKGVFADSRKENAMAIIESGSNDEKSYRVGDVVAGAATLHQILGDRVILKRGEQLETLYLPKEYAGTNLPLPQYNRVVPSNFGGSAISSAPRIDTSNMGDLRQKLMENPQDALQLINAQPVMENGQLTGFRVSPGKDRALFARVGLRPGDVITAVNGMQLSDATQMGQVFQQLKSAQQLEVTLNRGGREQQLQLKLD